MSIRILFLLCLSFSVVATAGSDISTQEEKKLSQEYLQKMAQEPDVQILKDGVVLRKIFQSNSATYPTTQDEVKVLYSGFDREGTIFDSAFLRDAAINFPLARLIPCWQIALPEISVGSVYKITCPTETAYGEKGAGKIIKPGAAISFRIILLEVN